MAFPPATLPTNRTNATPQQNTHPGDHNALAAAINDTVAQAQSLTAGAARRGVIAVQSGQQVGAGQVVTLGWSTLSAPDFGAGPGLTVPAGAGGLYVASLRVAGPVVPTTPTIGFGDVVINFNGTEYSTYVPGGKTQVALSVMEPLNPGQGISVLVYNPLGSSQFYAARLTFARVAI